MLDKKDFSGNAPLMRAVAELLNGWADDLDRVRLKKGRKAAVDQAPAKAPAEEMVLAAAAAASEPAPVSAPAPVVVPPAERPQPPYTYDAVHAYVGLKISQGFKAQVVALFGSYGAKKFSEVDPAYYGDLVEAVSALEAGDDHA